VTVAVPIVSTEEGELLRRCLPAVLDQPDVDVVVCDNASADSTAEVAREHGVRYVRFDERLDFCRAMNAALRETEGDGVLLVQPDCFLTPGFVEAARARLAEDDVGVVAPKLVRTTGPDEADRLDLLDSAGMVVDRRRKNGLVGHGRPSLAYDAPGEAFGADGAVALYRRAALEECALDGQVFDEDLVRWAADADLAWRVRLLGWRCAFEPRAVAFHIRSYSPSTRAQMPESDRRMQFRNRYLMIAKNDPWRDLVRDLPRIALYEVLAFGHALLRERHLLRGYAEAARLLPRMARKRRVLQRRRRQLAADGRPRAAAALPYALEPRP
jgi:GT2 family glycosyltransferase